MVYRLSFFIVAIFIAGCGREKNLKVSNKEKLNDFRWMLGEWQQNYADGSLMEVWNFRDDSSLAGSSLMIKGRDTLLSAKMLILARDSAVIFVPTIKGENNSLPVTFKLISQNDSITVFENRTHDFPQWIQYKKIGDSAMLAEIYGLKNGRFSREKFPMKKKANVNNP